MRRWGKACHSNTVSRSQSDVGINISLICRAAEEGTQSSSPTVYTSNVDISSKGHSNKQPSSKGWRWRRSSTRSRQRDRHSKHESGDNTFSNKDSINLAESQQISASSSQPATVAAGIPLPKVALMFLTRGDMPYEHTWRHFLEAVPMKGMVCSAGNHDGSLVSFSRQA